MGGEINSKTLKPRIRKIRLAELENFVQSDNYKSFSTVPVSPSRTVSYLNNPHGKPEDVVLILALANKELIAFRSFFAGMAHTQNETIRFGWCSGNWVHPDFRREGISKKLLEEAWSAWNGKLMFTNYAPESEKLYLKTGWFEQVHQFEGVRAYLFPKTVKLLTIARRNRFSKWIFSLVDSCIAGYSNLNVLFFSYLKNPDIRFETLPVPDEESYRFLEKQRENSLFGRDVQELKWIFQHPWISEINREVSNKYPFSSCSPSFSYTTVKVWQKDELTAVFIFSVRDAHLKTLFFRHPPEMNDEIARFIKKFGVKQKIEMVTIYNSAIAGHFFARKFPFLHVRKYGQKIYSSFKLGEVEKLSFQDGDGDVFFT
jgi:GNAT superfamily N-acetyltransferase